MDVSILYNENDELKVVECDDSECSEYCENYMRFPTKAEADMAKETIELTLSKYKLNEIMVLYRLIRGVLDNASYYENDRLVF